MRVGRNLLNDSQHYHRVGVERRLSLALISSLTASRSPARLSGLSPFGIKLSSNTELHRALERELGQLVGLELGEDT